MPTMDLVPYDSGIQFGTRYLTKEAAFFLGGIFSSAEYVKAGTDLYWIAPVRYNYGYATDLEIEEHFEDIKVMSSAMGAQTIMADNVRGTFLILESLGFLVLVHFSKEIICRTYIVPFQTLGML